MPEPSSVRCPKCGEPLWIHRVYINDLMFDREAEPIEVPAIEEDKWDYDEVVCHGCNYKPDFKWQETGLGHIIILT